MPKVIVNTSPLQYLFQLELLHLLPELYGKIIVPKAVAQELEQGRAWGVFLPVVEELSWVTISEPKYPTLLPLASGFGKGELQVLTLAKEIPDSLVVLDDGRARRYACLLNINVVGTLGILIKAKQLGKLEAIHPILEKLEMLHFRLHPRTRQAVLRLAGEI